MKQLDTHSELGIGFHRVLQTAGELGLEHYLALPSLALRIASVLKNSGISENDAMHHAQEIHSALKNMAEDSVSRWLFSSEHRDSTYEFSLSEITATGRKEHIVDRMFIDGDTRWVVDFKTSRPNEGESLSAFTQRELAQYNGQLLRYQRVVEQYDQLGPNSAPSHIKLALYFPYLRHFAELETK